MASLLPPSVTTTPPPVPTSITSSFLPKTSQLSIAGKRKPKFISRAVSCKATNGEQNPNPSAKNVGESSINKFDRRDVLVGLGGLYGVTSLNDPFAFAAPIAAPDLTKCGKADLPAGAKPVNCCPPPSTKILDFKLPPSNAPLRTRPAAHLVDDAYLAKFSRALELMKALPADDPRNFMQQANVHCAYCDGAYHQVGFPDLDLQVHNSWLFFPFHRYFLYFFEKILGKLIDDPTFAMPFWNWDSPAGMQMPAIYANPNSPLYDKLRNANHQPPTVLDLDYNGTDENLSAKDQISSNLKIMYRQMVSNGKTAKLFLGHAYRAGDEPDPGAGALENIPHGPVHIWCGDNTQPNLEDMGNFYSAGRDPIFYAHHSNVDRMWSVWKTLGGKRTDFTDSDWLDSAFLFYDENADLVRVKVRDCLDHRKLGYGYQKVDIPWLNTKPTPRRLASKVARALGVAHAAETKKKVLSNVQFPLVLNDVVSLEVARPKKSRSKKEKEEEEEVLVIENIEFDRDQFVKFDVYVNDEDDTVIGPDNTEFAGSFVNVPHKHKHGKKMKTFLRLGLTDLLEELNAEDDDGVVVTLVPKYGGGLVKIGGIKIEFSRD
ncbi:LOW QUALITY PROTEIN: polyphenol oxidase, chloroplastic-like [Durio zibethinus]|uniref:LOW QUALITY PROTEIN: polyphenol oxidase, chloroplastic-like n=1 Tax=Durio zibethinus TaxID=66656 RepID=A0A6P5WYD0_DURZI|nr:LOW QUALITY PROTEIN: polyphenol oxidase, chloroplastic-like [Durio zibethinus]